jgi:hypothetical protein
LLVVGYAVAPACFWNCEVVFAALLLSFDVPAVTRWVVDGQVKKRRPSSGRRFHSGG